ncbi:dentin matrix acidic phosphoprotein 1-like [Girardinichthys multiradiatus]|uniref:dentin matrix acidic phosphoprotein 1-like n=1 Tax=Girardinichthys multiradiatus TaxID=208333 RepID=UPI001FADB903|nr:dentin matrix acidic phosphoprotein 1-like [Girardinichthys multiradiatus]
MKRRSFPRSNSGQEDEEGQSCDRKHSLRKRKCVIYWDHADKNDDGDDNDNDDDDNEEEEEEEQENYNQIPPHNWDKDLELWPVICGTKEGMMDAKKLEKSLKCIECEGRHFTPPAFEDFAGKSLSKKWKATIYSDGKPLQYWFDKGLLVTRGYLKKRTESIKTKAQTFQNNKDKSAHNLRQHDSLGGCILMEESEAEFTEDSEEEDVSERLPGSKNRVLRMEEKKGGHDDRNGGDYVNSDHQEEKQDDKLDQHEIEEDGDASDDPKDLCAPKKTDPRLIISTPEKLALQMKMKVMLKRMSVTRSDCPTTTMNHLIEGEEKKDRASRMTYCEKEKDSETEELLEMAVPEDSEEPIESETVDVATNNCPQPLPVEEEIHESLRLSAAPLNMPGQSRYDNHTDVSSSDQIESQILSETSIQGSASAHLSDKVEISASGVLAGSDVNTMDLHQLQREMLKMQLDVLRLQKEYYTLKLKDLNCYN